MSISSVIATVEAEAVIWAEKAAHYLEGVAISAAQKAVALLKETSVGTAVMNLVSAYAASPIAGASKFDAVVGAVEGIYNAFVNAGGLKGLLAVGVSVLRQLVQLIFDDFAATFAKPA